MIGGEHSVRIARPVDELWSYLASFSSWAPHVVGFQSLREVDDKTTVWTLRGDVGILSREVEIEVTVSAWDEGRSAAFTLTGLTERLDGTGSFEVRPAEEEAPAPTVAAAPPKLGWWARFRRRMARRMIRRARGTTPAPVAAPADTAETAGPASYLTFRLEVAPGGPMAPMVEMLMEPLLVPAAEDLSLQIKQALEGGAR
ncbi:MAG: SRPBCC family protein [Actinomycetales bacterium]|nr:MAG: SRPBCC family protein [Actinomycetales bacterium]